jgi:hypothetical protein
VVEIVGNKNDFSKAIQQEDDPNLFVNFAVVFNVIDSICHKEIDYLD